MAIELNLNRTAAQTYRFNETRLQKVLTAQTLNEAQRMGLWDRIKDWRAGGVKAEAIRTLYQSVADPQPHESQPLQMLHRFERLKSLVADDSHDQFSSQITGGITQGETRWAFSLQVAGIQLYRSEDLNDAPPNSSIDFAHHQAVYTLTHALVKAASQASSDQNTDTLWAERLSPHRQAFLDGLQQAFGNYVVAGEDETVASAALRRVIELRHDGNPVLSTLHEVELGETRLAEFIWPEQAEQVGGLVQFERARENLETSMQGIITSNQFQGSISMVNNRLIDPFIEQSLATVSDDPEVQGHIRSHLDDELFSADHFKGVIPGKASDEFPTFKAVFERDGHRVELELSNRPGSNGELRGDSLKTLIQESRFGNLRALLSLPFGSPKDDQIIYLAAGFSQTLSWKLGFESPETLQPFLIDLRDHGPQHIQDRCFDQLSGVKLGKTSLLEMVMGDQIPDRYRSPDSIDPNAEPPRVDYA